MAGKKEEHPPEQENNAEGILKDIKIGLTEFIYVWNRFQNQGTPAHHIKISQWLEERCMNKMKRNGLLMAFRHAGKSTIVGLFCAWRLQRDANSRILIVAADHELAKKMVRNIKRILEVHPLTAHLIPKKKVKWASDSFIVNRSKELRDPSVIAKGITSNITGSRAEIIICDDVEVPRTAGNINKRKELRERLLELDFVISPDGLQIYIGTPHAFDTIYNTKGGGKKEGFLSGFDDLKVQVLDSYGNSAWPEKFPLEKIEQIKKRVGSNKFLSQMMLEPVDMTQRRLDEGRMKAYAADLFVEEKNNMREYLLLDKRMVSANCFWDPAYGAREKADSSVIAAVFFDGEGRAYIHRVGYLKVDDRDGDAAHEQVCMVANFLRDLPLTQMTVETNGIGKFLPALLRKELTRKHLKIRVVEEHSRVNKEERIIRAFDALLDAGAVSVHASVLATPFIEEMREFRPGYSGRDDGLDAVAGCLLAKPVRLQGVSGAAVFKGEADWEIS